MCTVGDIYGPVSLQMGWRAYWVQRSRSCVTECGREGSECPSSSVYYKETVYQKKHLDSIAF